MRTPLDQRLVRLTEFSKQWNKTHPEHSLPETLDDWLVETGAWENCIKELSSVALALGKSPGGGFQSIFARSYAKELATFFS